uniref:Nuclear RNA export factor 2B n=1 Tax=Scleropages formosus TaxID=113540 RepID=A0A8C9SR61_SCLFO
YMNQGNAFNVMLRLVGGPQFRHRKGRGPFRTHMYSEQPSRQRNRGAAGGGAPGPRSRFEDDDGDVAMNDSSSQDGSSSSQRRFNPYGRQNRRGNGRFDRDRRGGNDGHRAGGGGGGGSGGRRSWFKMTIPHGKKYDKKWLLTALQNLCSVPFTPVHYHTEGNRAQFYIDDASTANALSKVSRKITDTEGYKVCVVPFLLIFNRISFRFKKKKKKKKKKHLILFCGLLLILSDLVSQNIEVVLNRKNCMQAVIKIIEENIPELACLNLSNNKLYKLDDLAELVGKVPNLKTLNLSHNELKTERELDKVKGFKLVELWLERNPLCDHFKDQSSYVSAVRERFPRLLKLDGHDLPPPIGFDVEAPTTLPPCKGSYFFSDEIKSLILRFLQQYYSIYDSGDRQPLLDAYHDGASFSLSIPFSVQNPSRCSLGEYHKDSRNIKKLKDPTTRFRLLKHTRLNVVAFLNELPKTQHDIASFTVDVMFTISQKSTTFCFSIIVIFLTTCLLSPSPSIFISLCIVNDELFVRNATTEEIRKAFAAPAPTPSSSPVPTLSAPQQEMLSSFSQKSGMNLEWSQKCLQDNDWDFNRAAQIFTQLKV